MFEGLVYDRGRSLLEREVVLQARTRLMAPHSHGLCQPLGNDYGSGNWSKQKAQRTNDVAISKRGENGYRTRTDFTAVLRKTERTSEYLRRSVLAWFYPDQHPLCATTSSP